MDLQSVVGVYVDEGEELLRALEEGFLTLEAAPDSRERLRRMRSAACTLKGTSALMGFARIAAVANTLEDHLAALRDGQLDSDVLRVTLFLELVDALRRAVRTARLGEPEDVGAAQVALARLARALQRPAMDKPVLATSAREERPTRERLLDVTGLVREGASREAITSALEKAEARLRELEEQVLEVQRRATDALRPSVPARGAALQRELAPGFAVSVGASTYALPLDAVVECMELPPEARGSRAGRGTLRLRGEVLSFLRLRAAFGAPPAPEGASERLVVVRGPMGLAALVVDALLGQRYISLQTVPAQSRPAPGLVGTVAFEDGRTALLLDLPTLLSPPGTLPGVKPRTLLA